MNVENLTGNTYFLGRADLRLNPLATLVVADAIYNADNAVAQAINELDEENQVTVTSAPVGYPRDLGAAGGLSEAEVQDLIDASAGISFETICALLGATSVKLFEDVSGNPVDWMNSDYNMSSVTGTPTYEADGPGSRKAIQLDAGEVLTGPVVPNAGTWPYTQVIFVYLLDAPDANGEYLLFDGNDAANGMGIVLGTARKFAADPGGFAAEADSTAAIPLNEWHMVATRGRSGTFDVGYWYDDALDKAYDAMSLNAPSGGNFRIGKSDTTYAMRVFGAAQFSGLLLSDGQLKALYDSVL